MADVTKAEVVIRKALAKDAEVIARQRMRMFEDAGQADAQAMAMMVGKFVDWVSPRLEDGRYLGWLVEEAGAVIGGAGVWLMDFPPHWMDAEPVRAYLLNFYVNPEYRGRGLAKRLLDVTLAAARQRGVKVMSLHASKFGRPIYERNGFVGSNEMLLWDGAVKTEEL